MPEPLYPSFGILLVDDEPAWLRSVALTLERSAGITNIHTCSDSRQAMDILAKGGFGLVLLDLTMPHLSGEDLLTMLAEQHPEITCIVISGQNQVNTAVSCIKKGAFDYFVKTVEEDRLVGGVLRAIRMRELERENREMSSRLASGGLRRPDLFSPFVTADPAMLTLIAYIEAVAKSPQPLMISGESGTGKELLARAAHGASGCKGALVAINVAGLDDTVFSDTLFGHQRGAYTGADQPRKGMIEEAAEGTLFLDEIGDLSIASQVKLLRLLQEGEYYPLGSDRPKRLRARVIVATHADLAAKEASGQFRRDLYYRLQTHQVRIPALRDRRCDIPLLLEHFLTEAAHALGKKKPTAPRELAQLLATYAFPGNVRELRALVYDAVSLHTGGVLSMERFITAVGTAGQAGPSDAPQSRNPFSCCERLPTFGEAAELLVTEAMQRSSNNQTIAARLLGISQPALSKRLKQREQ